MIAIYDKKNGPLILNQDTELFGMVAGDATVESGVTLLLRGTITGNLLVRRGAVAVIDGMVNGTVTNAGANVEINGTIDDLHETESAKTRIGPHATIHARKRP